MCSVGEEAREFIDYFARLAEQTSAEEIQPEYRTDELLKDIERFLRDKGEQKGGH